MRDYYDKLNEVVNVILETDIPTVSDISFETSWKLKKLLSQLATSVPYTPNLSKLSSQLYIEDYRTLLKYMTYLENAALLNTLSAKVMGNKILNKPRKVYLNNTNLVHSVSPLDVNIGTVRETFLLNQLSTNIR